MLRIDGKEISQQIKDELKVKVAKYKEEGKEISMAVILVGNDPASAVYVGNKKKACEYIGIKSLSYELEVPVCFVGTGEKIDDIEAYMYARVEEINAQLPAFSRINKVIIRKEDFVRTPSMKIARNCNGNNKK